MAMQITFSYEGRDYTLEFTRASVKRMEDQGFKVHSAEAAPMSAAFDLFRGAFFAHHRNIDSRTVEKIFGKLGDLNEWTADLLEMYKDTFEPTNASDGEEKEGGIQRTKSW